MQHMTDCAVTPITDRVSDDDREVADKVHLAVADMGCPNCGNRVRNALMAVDGVLDAEIDVPAGLVTVWFDAERAATHNLVAAVAKAGQGTHHNYLAVPVGQPQGSGPTEPEPACH